MARLPPDLLWTEWYRGRKPELRHTTRGRHLAVYRHNLLDHIGAQSSFASRAVRPGWPRCFHPMSDIWSLAKTEKFNVRPFIPLPLPSLLLLYLPARAISGSFCSHPDLDSRCLNLSLSVGLLS